MKSLNITPFVKWAGGKRQLLTQISERMPLNYNKYYEPFVGGGAVVFGLQPENAVINDINAALINTYEKIQQQPNKIMELLEILDSRIPKGGKEYYYGKRDYYNEKLKNEEYDIELAALFIFLNKHCFNGLYRVNAKGLFNVPYNNSTRASYKKEEILCTSEYLKKIEIIKGDFEEVCKNAQQGDFIFLDSPYAPLNPTSFESYTKEGFDVESHIRLSKLYKGLTSKGCYCMLTNHNTEFIRSLYSDFKIDVVSVKRMINSDASNRVGEEVIIRNY